MEERDAQPQQSPPRNRNQQRLDDSLNYNGSFANDNSSDYLNNNDDEDDQLSNNSSEDIDTTTQSLIEEISTKSFRASPSSSHYQQTFLNTFNGNTNSAGGENTVHGRNTSSSSSTSSSQLRSPVESVSTHQRSPTASNRKKNQKQQLQSNHANNKHFNVQCYRGMVVSDDEQQELLINPKSITIEWVFDDCITQRYIHKMLRRNIGSEHFSDVHFLFTSQDYSNLDTVPIRNTTFTISETACELIPSIACKIDEGKIQTIELQIPFCFHFAIDYPEDLPSLLSAYNQKVTMEGCVVFSSQVFVQIFEWCEYYANHTDFIQLDLEGKGMMFCCNSESYFKSVIGEWNWNFLQSMDKNLLLQTLIMSHILSITPLLLMIKTKIMFDVRQKCKEAISNQPSHASTKIQFLNYFVQDPSKCQTLINNSPTIHHHHHQQTHSSSSPLRTSRHTRSSSYDKIRGLTSSSSSNKSLATTTSSTVAPHSVASTQTTASTACSSSSPSSNLKSSMNEEKVLATLGDSEKGLIHFMRIR